MDIGLSQKNARAAPIRKRISAETQKGMMPRFSRSVRAGPTKRAVSVKEHRGGERDADAEGGVHRDLPDAHEA
jgi:hypothetical protein